MQLLGAIFRGNQPRLQRIHRVAADGNIDELRALGSEADLNARDQDGWTPLHYAIWNQHSNVVEELIRRGAEVDVAEKNGRPPSHLASLKNDADALRALIAAGASPDTKDKNGWTAIQKAVNAGHLDASLALIHAGADLTWPTSEGDLLMHLAVAREHVNLVQALAAAGVGVDMANSRTGRTALHLAADRGVPESVVSALLQLGANPSQPDADDQTPVELARIGGHTALEVLLEAERLQRLRIRDDGWGGPGPAAAAADDDWGSAAAPPAAAVSDRSTGTVPVPPAPPAPCAASAPDVASGPGTGGGPGRMRSRMRGDTTERRDSFDSDDLSLSPREGLPQSAGFGGVGASADDGWGAGVEGDGWGNTGAAQAAAMQQRVLSPEEAYQKLLELDRRTALRQGWRTSASGATPEAVPQDAIRYHLAAMRMPSAPEAVLDSAIAPVVQDVAAEAGENYMEAKAQLAEHAVQLRSGSCPCPLIPYQEVYEATAGFAPSNELGGSWGRVFRGYLQRMRQDVAVKVLDISGSQGGTAFNAELDTISRLRHPNIVSLLGACPAYGILVYEMVGPSTLDHFLGNGSAAQPQHEQRHLPWNDRVRIAKEVATALAFLHANSPRPLLHRNLWPATVFLDANRSAKLGNLDLRQLFSEQEQQGALPGMPAAFLDPECVQSGRYRPDSDLYALGITLLRMLTGKAPEGLAHEVARMQRFNMLHSVVDGTAGTWPPAAAAAFAQLALQCCRRPATDRPRLDHVLLTLDRLTADALQAAQVPVGGPGGGAAAQEPPSMFLCPITADIMVQPVCAADGYTYERSAIEQWLATGKNTSPMTNAVLPSTILLPNRVLRSAIMEWLHQQQKQQ